MNEPLNQFDKLDAQSEVSRFAQLTTAEHAEYQAWLDMVATARDSAGDITPEHVDGSASNS
jgi:hypothetical protein